MPRTLLLTGTAPDPTGVGGIILDALCRFMPAGTLGVAYLPEGAGIRSERQLNSGVAMWILPTPYERRPMSRFGRAGKLVAAIGQSVRNRRNLEARVDDCIAIAQAHCAQQIWAVLDTPVAIELAATVSRKLGLPLRALVWDDVEHNVRHFQLDRFTASRVRRRFATAVRQAVASAVIGETMQAEYARRYGTRGTILRHGVEIGGTRPAATPSAGVRIGFAGSVSGRSAFELLLAALDGMRWQIDGQPVTLVLLGPRFDLWSSVERRVECLGWRSVEDTISILSGCTVNYLPQPFELDWRAFSELSFPSKLTTYLAAGQPVLLHAPKHASLPAFFERHPFGLACTELDATALTSVLRRLVLDDVVRAKSIVAAREALEQEFSAAHFRKQFATFFDISASALRH